MSLAPPPPHFDPALMAFAGNPDNALIITTDKPLNSADRADVSVTGDTGLAAAPCRALQRFDRSSALAYRFQDGQSRLALNVKLNGGQMEKTMLRFSYKFQPLKGRNDHCLYNSPVQGLVGSIVNTLVVRKDHSIWHELNAKSFRLWE